MKRLLRRISSVSAFGFVCGLSAYEYPDRRHLFFVEGSLGSTSSAALERESEAINQQGVFYWPYSGNLYRYRTSDLTLTAGIGYEYIVFSWIGLRGTYSYSSYLHDLTARSGSGRYGRSSSIGGQVAETDGFFIGPVFRYAPFNQNTLAIEIPLQWGIHGGSYYPLNTYSELRDSGVSLPPLPDERTRQALLLHKWRYGIGVALFTPRLPFYASMAFCVEQSFTKTAIGPTPLMPEGSTWNTFLLIFTVGWRL